MPKIAFAMQCKLLSVVVVVVVAALQLFFDSTVQFDCVPAVALVLLLLCILAN